MGCHGPGSRDLYSIKIGIVGAAMIENLRMPLGTTLLCPLAEPIATRPSVTPTTAERCKLMHRLVYWRFNCGDAVLDRLLHLFKGAHLDLAHALTRHTKLIS